MLFLALAVFLAGCGDLQLGGFTPAAPSNLGATIVQGGGGSQQVALTWSATAGTTVSQGATFTVYRGSTPGLLTDKVAIAQGLATASYTDSTSGPGVWYYQVTATIYTLESAPSNEVSVTLTGSGSGILVLTVSSSSSVNNLNWNPLAGASGYTLYRGMTASGSLVGKLPWKTIDAGLGITSFTDTTVAVGLTYYYLVVATYSSGQSPLSNEIALTTVQ